MCSFIVASFLFSELLVNMTWVNSLNRLRGPDATNTKVVRGWEFLHNLLHMTGERTLQPFTSGNGETVALFNGEIYNWKELAAATGKTYRSDGHAILPLYEKHGRDFLKHARGEFAVVVVDFSSGEVIVGTDAFMTKPVFTANWTDSKGRPRFAVSSYGSSLLRMGAPDATIEAGAPNAVRAYSVQPPHQLVWQREIVQWDLRQFKNSTADWIAAFERSVRRRSTNIIHGVFIGLSSGFDSGAIMLALHRQGVHFHAYTVRASEDSKIVENRAKFCSSTATSVRLNSGSLTQEHEWLQRHCEPYTYKTAVVWPHGSGRPVWDDPASQALSGIVHRVRKLGGLIYLSGSGADETISDYTSAPGKCVGSCSFQGKWPEDLRTIFPWRNFYQGVQRDYIMKEELVGGAHGIETRYPFLDPEVVQEYLWLSREAKLSVYKRPLHDYMSMHNFPFKPGVKQGFGLEDNTCRKVKRGRKRFTVCENKEEEMLSDNVSAGSKQASAQTPQPHERPQIQDTNAPQVQRRASGTGSEVTMVRMFTGAVVVVLLGYFLRGRVGCTGGTREGT
eukprot:Hpha_TRINITY_DN2423_c0_g1::TRINITY_DN2423_c0_g1_i1::g.24703::m.24703/K01953/asnB, ASNS; asparagine synthase (glutamine-hydrolysing)